MGGCLHEPATVRGWLDTSTPEPMLHLATFGSSGALYGTAVDLLAFERALLNDRLLDVETTRLAWTGEPRLGYVALSVWALPALLKGGAGTVDLVERRALTNRSKHQPLDDSAIGSRGFSA